MEYPLDTHDLASRREPTLWRSTGRAGVVIAWSAGSESDEEHQLDGWRDQRPPF
jgi:hypothetical protein